MGKDNNHGIRDDWDDFYDPDMEQQAAQVANLDVVNGEKRIYDKSRTNDLLQEWLGDDDPLKQLKAKYEQLLKDKKLKYRNQIQKHLRYKKTKRRCSNCL